MQFGFHGDNEFENLHGDLTVKFVQGVTVLPQPFLLVKFLINFKTFDPHEIKFAKH